MNLKRFFATAICVIVWQATLLAQRPGATEPVEGLRDAVPQIDAIEHVAAIVRPGQRIENATILIREGRIVAIGQNVEVPPGARRHDHQGRLAYAGLINAYSEAQLPAQPRDRGAPNWNGNIMPQRQASAEASGGLVDGKKLRSQGIAISVVAPADGILKGTSCLLLTGDGDSGQTLLGETNWQHATLTVPRRSGGLDNYPNSPMGATALLRQALLDAQWYEAAWSAHRGNRSLPQPKHDLALAALAEGMKSQAFVLDAANERMALRADAVAKEFGLEAILRGSGREYRQLAEIVATDRPILVPVDFPDAPKITEANDAREISLADLLQWELAPSNPARLVQAGATICLTTDGLSDVDKFLSQVRKAVEAGLPADDALAATTINPAGLLGISDMTGTLQVGKLANLVIADGELFEAKTKMLETWVAGRRYEVTKPIDARPDRFVGRWEMSADLIGDAQPEVYRLELTKSGESLKGFLSGADAATDQAENKPPRVELKNLVVQRDRFSASCELSELDNGLPSGVSWLTFMLPGGIADHQVVGASILLPNGRTTPVVFELATAEAAIEEGDQAEKQEPTPEVTTTKDEEDAQSDEPFQVVYPLGAYGLAESPATPPMVMFRHATIWTCGPQGVIENGDLLLRDGKIAAIGSGLEVPEGCQVVDVGGKHLSPGLIDCHSHMATDGGVNESGQAITAEVRIGDFIDNSDISIYRQMAGGLTTSNILHGSANPIGGQNQVIKLRWGATMDEMRLEGAPKGIKFALGENVKRRSGRYPDTRMGVEQIIHDQLLAAQEYAAHRRRYEDGDRTGLPPRVDLQMEALAEVLSGERWIHCHSYRQDEIIALLDVLDEMGVTIGSLQHILEGYKVADRMAEHGATASSFSDWWAYKFEVYDAIPYNGALMHENGIVVSFNSDDAELARHMNTEAAKAVKYGGVSPEEALKFVTLNPAKQLRIDDRVGSLEVGKDADVVVWSRSPLSTMTRCEQTWIDGKQYFSLQRDQELRQRDAHWHARLVQKALGGDGKPSGARQPRVAEEDRWHRHDIFCLHHGHEQHEEEHRADALLEEAAQ